MMKKLTLRFIEDMAAAATAVAEFILVGLPYIPYVMRHKWFVLVVGLRLGGIPLWRLLAHDWQKFSRWEFMAYARKTAGGYHNDKDEAIEEAFTAAWLHHENTAPHHRGYWIPRSGKMKGRPLPMPETYVREMVADWLGAGRAYTGSWDMTEWLNEKAPTHQADGIHLDTELLLDKVLAEAGYAFDGFYGRYVPMPPKVGKA